VIGPQPKAFFGEVDTGSPLKECGTATGAFFGEVDAGSPLKNAA
jgi:hypothetical protein